jgi:hypothetical protein
MPLEPVQPRAAESPWLGRHEREVAGFESDPGESSQAPLSGSMPLDSGFATFGDTVPGPLEAALPEAGQSLGPALHAETEEQARERARSQAASLHAGDWVDLHTHDKWRRAQLTWISSNGALFMFISRGGRSHSMTKRTCERLFRLHQLRQALTGAVVDKAMHEMGLDGSAPASELRVV